MYTFGGVLMSDKRTNKLTMVDVTAPSLQELCLQKLLESFPSLFDADLYTLKKTGIPRKHAARIIP